MTFFVSGSPHFKKFYKSLGPKRRLRKDIDNAIDTLKGNPRVGDKITKNLWPERYEVDNLWRYPLGDAYRMIYTIISDGLNITSVILDVFSHKEYDIVFRY